MPELLKAVQGADWVVVLAPLPESISNLQEHCNGVWTLISSKAFLLFRSGIETVNADMLIGCVVLPQENAQFTM